MARATVMNRFVKGFCVVVGLAMVAGTVSYAAGTRIIRMEDQCDPETFNAVFGDASVSVATQASPSNISSTSSCTHREPGAGCSALVR